MRAIVVSRHGGPEVLEPVEREDPVPGPGEVLIDLAASGVNYIDVYFRTGAYKQAPPFVPGQEGAGTVAAVGEGVTGVAPGDRVAWQGVLGSYAQRAVVPADRTVPVPDGLSLEDAAASLLQGMTAHYLTHSTYAVRPGDTVLVHAAAGGMGLLLTQIAKLRGARVIGTVSTPEKERLAREAGADEVVGYDGFAAQVRRLTGGEGVAAVYDGVGAATFDGSLESLRPRGTLALYGAASGQVPPFDPQRLNAAGSLFLTRPTLAHYTLTRDELLERAAAVHGWIARGELRLHIGGRYDLADARRAHEDLEGRRTTGKLLLLP
ncbi:quinone oxidoreductase [Actinomadura sp. NBRC 104425]|uniref:quinone oxidoreductase family protein n=1 Tax=Actinomadura sp. NBRC 104425 TaxID=3032204 RepID=UPI0024A4355E|nr:quinone oxidoreductase [Actinomadura sp. NBRC 104425]GLZ13534.1 quinone oxidoreductase [Actinomadura sp. NBRC 104425]